MTPGIDRAQCQAEWRSVAMRRFLGSITALTIAASVLLGPVAVPESGAVRPWLNRVDKPISQIFMEQDFEKPDDLHPGIDFPPYAQARWDTFTAVVPGWFIDCDDSLSTPAGQTFVLFEYAGDHYYRYLHIAPQSVRRQYGLDCDQVEAMAPAIDVDTPVAESWYNPPYDIFGMHFEASETQPWEIDFDYVHNPLLDFESDLLVADQSEPFPYNCNWFHYALWGTVIFKADDTTWNDGTFAYEQGYDWPYGFRTGVYRAWVMDRWIDPDGIVLYEKRGGWTLDYFWMMDFNELYDWCGPNFTDCYYVLDFELGQEPGEHRYTLYVADYSGLTASCSVVGIDREISDIVATPGDQAVSLSWYARSFDPGTLFYVDRSTDGGVTYDYRLRDEFGEPLFLVYYEEGTYSMPDSSVEYDFPYLYRIVDTEGGPGPDPYWEMEELMQGEIGGLPDPPAPVSPPQISFKSMAVTDSVGYAGIWFDAGTAWAGWYRAGFDEDGPPYAQEAIHFGSKELCLADLTPGATYHVGARGESFVGTTELSNEVVFTVVPATTLLSVELVDRTSIVAAWRSVAPAQGYDLICTKMHPTPQDTVVDAGADTTWRVDNLHEYEEYCVRVKCRDAYGNRTEPSNREYVVTGGFGGIEEIASVGEPTEDRLFQNYPNPFNPETRIPYQISSTSTVQICVFDVAGRLVRTIVSEPHAPGSYLARWDGTDSEGVAAPPGVYFLRLSTPSAHETVKMILAK